MGRSFKLLNIKNRIIIFAFLVCFIIAFPLFEVYILSFASQEHEHGDIGDTCTTCAQIQDSVNLLKQLVIYASGALSVSIYLVTVTMFFYSVLSLTRLNTLINLKIRMNN